jgi:hypothetical protein
MEHDRVPKVLLLGNGIDRAFDLDAWSNSIRPAWTREMTEDQAERTDHMSAPLQPILLMGDGAGDHGKELAATLSALRISPQEAELLKDYLALPVDAVLTTNCTYALEKAADPELRCRPGRRCKRRRLACTAGGRYEVQLLQTYFACSEETPPIWHMRGEAARPDSMILDYYAYGKLLARMQQYASTLISRYNLCAAKGRTMKLYSWLDYFMLGEVHIVGQEMALCEPDLWWLVSCKKRYFPDRSIVLYQPDIKPEERLLAEAYGVTVDDDGFFGRYREYYTLLRGRLESKLRSLS